MPINNFRNITTTGFNEDALTTFSPNDDVRNFAMLTTLGDLANGIFVGADGVSVANLGHIETSGSAAEGVLIEGAGAQVRDFGSIVTHGDFSDAIAAYGNNFDLQSWGSLETHGFAAAGMDGIGDGGLIRNFGSINTSGDFSYGMVAFGNGEEISNFGSVSTSGFIAQGLFADGDGNRIVNFGTVHIQDPLGLTSSMIAVGSQNEVVNFGAITGGGIVATGHGISGSGNVATNWGTISTDAADPAMLVTGSDAVVQNFGTIEATFAGMLALGDIGAQARNAGRITAHGTNTFGDLGYGIKVDTGANGEAANTGTIFIDGIGAAGIEFTSVLSGEVTNSGSIETFGGVSGLIVGSALAAFGLDVVVHNTRTGSIETHDPNSPAVRLNDHDVEANFFRPGIIAADTHAFLENDGLINAAQTAVLGGAGDETVINHGQIVGNVVLGNGADTFVFAKGGSLDGDLFLGGGDDLVSIEKGAGSMRIADFAPGNSSGDVIDISAFYSSFSDLAANSQQVGNDVYIGLGHNDQIVLENVKLAALNAGDFQFNPALMTNYMASSFVASGGVASGTLLADAGGTEVGLTSQPLTPHSV